MVEKMADTVSIVFLFAGSFFFIAGSLGVLRFPDIYSRLHALTKCDNLGLGLVAWGLLLQADSLIDVLKLLAIWLFILMSSGTAGHLIARRARQLGLHVKREVEPK